MLTLDEIKKLCADSQTHEIAAPVLDDPRLQIWPLNCADDSHHSCVGGLMNHLCEVISSGILMCNLYSVYFKVDLNVKDFIVGAVWHYYGKFLTFTPNDETYEIWKITDKTPYSTLSVAAFTKHFCALQADSTESLETKYDISYQKIIEIIMGFESSSPESTLLKNTIQLSKTIHT